jgi:hypothetical protein
LKQQFVSLGFQQNLDLHGLILLWGIVTPPTTTTRLGGVTTLQDNSKTKTIENIGIKLNDQSKRKQLPSFNLNQRV